MQFAADAMLGRLARWLRVLSFDTFYDEAIADPALVRLAAAEDRVLLTRDRLLLRELRPVRALELRDDRPLAQLQHVVRELALPAPVELFTRCMLCNAVLDTVPPDEVPRVLPPGVSDVPPPVRRCPRCGKVYWHGSHVGRMRRTIEGALPGWLPP